MNKIHEVKKKLGEYRANKFLVGCDIHETAADALTVINEQEGEIDRLNREIKRLIDAVGTEKTERELVVVELNGVKKELEAKRVDCVRLRNGLDFQRNVAQYHERRAVEWHEKYVAANRENEELKGRLACTDSSSLEDAKINIWRLKDELTARENELTAARKELETVKAAFDEEQQKAAGVFSEKVKLTVKNNELKETLNRATADALNRYSVLEARIENLSKENSILAERVAKEESKNSGLILELNELRRKASSFVLDPDEVEKIIFDRCPVCKHDFRLFVKRGERVNVTGASPRKYANCPKCGEAVNDYDNKTSCGHCGTLLDWGSEGGK